MSRFIFRDGRTGVRVAEGAGLENRYTLTGIVGSNPTLSVLPAVLRSRRRDFVKKLTSHFVILLTSLANRTTKFTGDCEVSRPGPL